MPRLTVRGSRWALKFPARPRLNGQLVDGLCDQSTKTISVQRDLRDRRLVEVVVEEVIHAALWDLDEPCVQDMAKAITDALYHKDIWGRFHDQEVAS